MFVKVKAHGVYRYIKSQNSELLSVLKTAPDFEVELDDSGEIKLFSATDVSGILRPVSTTKDDLAASLGVKKTSTRKTSK